jgi:putative redox protein
MKSKATWIKGLQSTVDNGRGHEIIIDLPDSQGGEDIGATALELALMGLSGCISTIFAMLANKSRLEFESLDVIVDAEKGKSTIETVDIKVNVKTLDSKKADKILNQTLEMCPVGVLYKQAGVNISHELIVE